VRIQKLEIDAFGGLVDYELLLTDGLCYLYGENETGKSTICAFISAMLYGLQGKGASDERKRYMPWSGRAMGGSMHFTADGKGYLLKRAFGKTAKGDKCHLYDAATWQELPLPVGSIGEHFLGVGAEGFRKTLYISQMGAGFTKSNEDEILSRLSNLEQTGEEDIFLQTALSELEGAAFGLVSKTGRGGALTQKAAEIDALCAELEEAKKLHNSFKDLLLQIKTLTADLERDKQHIEELSSKKEVAALYAQYVQREAVRKQKQEAAERLEKEVQTQLSMEQVLAEKKAEAEALQPAVQSGISAVMELAQKEAAIQAAQAEEKACEQLKNEVYALEQEVDALSVQKNSGAYAWLIAGIFLLCGGIVLSLLWSKLFLIISPVAFVLLFLFGKGMRKKSERQKMREEAERRYREKQVLLEERIKSGVFERQQTLRNDMKALLDAAGASSADELSQKIKDGTVLASEIEHLAKEIEKQKETVNELRLCCEGEAPAAEEPVPDPGIDAETVQKQIENLQTKALENERQLARLQAQYENGFGNSRSVATIDEELIRARESYEEMQFSHQAVQLAYRLLTSCQETLQNEFTPKLNEQLSRYISLLTGDRYTQTKVSDTYTMTMKEKMDSSFVESSHVSGGTYDLIYFALRLAVLQTLFGKIPLLILDDAFIQFDEERREKAFAILAEEAEGQVLYFSCHKPRASRQAEQTIYLKSYQSRKMTEKGLDDHENIQ